MKDLRNLPQPVLDRLASVIGDDEPGRGQRRGFDVVSRSTLASARLFTPETRALDGGGCEVSGYATVYDYAYNVGGTYGWDEIIAQGACAKSLAEQDRCVFLVNHDSSTALGVPLAATYSGDLTLSEDKVGLRTELTLLPTNTVAEMLIDGLLNKRVESMSFAFRVTRQEWNEDYTERTIRELQLFDVSAVTYPANPAATITARDENTEIEIPASLDWRRRELEALRLRSV